MPVVGHFDPRTLLATPAVQDAYQVDFTTVTIGELTDIIIPINWAASYTGIIHGVAGWFDLMFAPPPYDEHNPDGLQTTVLMSTGPADERTHWQQVRFLFKEPLAVNGKQPIRGWMRCIVNDMRSYTIFVELAAGEAASQLSDPTKLDKANFTSVGDYDPLRRRGKWELHEQTYNYSFTPGYMPDHKPEYSCLYETGNSSADIKNM